MEGALIKVLNIFAGYRSVDLRDDIPVTHSHLETKMGLQSRHVCWTDKTHLVEISVFSLLSFLFGFVEILFAVFHLGQTLLVVGPPTRAAALNHQSWHGTLGN